MKKAVVLLSGGLDSATTLYIAKDAGYKCHALIFHYGQRHNREIESAKKIAESAGAEFHVMNISLPWKGSSLLDKNISVPKSMSKEKDDLFSKKKAKEIPSTYVPARNIVFSSFALSYAEAIGASRVYIGAHAQDYSGYPDCRPEFFRAFNKVARVGIKAKKIEIVAPLLKKTKAKIIRAAHRLGVPFELTWSCYEGLDSPCGSCDSCYFREKGFKEAGLFDPLTRKNS